MTRLDIVRNQIAEGRLSESITHLEVLQREDPDSSEINLLLGITLVRLGKHAPAQIALERVLGADPDCFEASLLLVRTYRALSDAEAAQRVAHDIVQRHPLRSEGFGALGDCLLQSGQVSEALESFQKAISLAPNVSSYRLSMAQCHQALGHRAEADEELRRAFEVDPQNPKVCLALGSNYCKFGLIGKGLDVLTEGLRHSPNHVGLLSATASAYTLIRNDVEAEKLHRRAVAISKQAKVPYAVWLSDQGRNQEALALYEDLIREFPKLGAAHYGVVQCRQGEKIEDPFVSKMEELLDDESIDPTSRMYLNYALGKVNEQRKRYEAAIGCFDEANALAFRSQAQSAPFDAGKTHLELDLVKNRYEELRDRSVWGRRGPAPIFIIGMIRSGTTLLDQIVSSHPSVATAGELRFWIEKSLWLAYRNGVTDSDLLKGLADEYLEYASLLVGGSERFTDKMPLYCFYAGIIHRVFPDARFLHIRRHPVDTCLSIYSTYFGTGSEFVYNRSNTVAYYKLYQQAMDYWRRELPSDRLLEIDYEDLISDPEPVIRKAIAFCGLPWDEACLHHERNQSAINTPSRWQARRPIYQTSRERWRNYEPWLAEFAELIPSHESEFTNVPHRSEAR